MRRIFKKEKLEVAFAATKHTDLYQEAQPCDKWPFTSAYLLLGNQFKTALTQLPRALGEEGI